MTWIPARFVRRSQVCAFCRSSISPARPGSTTGTRGTKAWFNPATGEWECLECHEEASRAEAARQRELDIRRASGEDSGQGSG